MNILPDDCIIYIVQLLDFNSYVRFLRSNKMINQLLVNPQLIRIIFKLLPEDNLMQQLKYRFKYFVFDYDNKFVGREYINDEFNNFTLNCQLPDSFKEKEIEIYKKNSCAFYQVLLNFELIKKPDSIFSEISLFLYFNPDNPDHFSVSIQNKGKNIAYYYVHYNKEIQLKVFCNFCNVTKNLIYLEIDGSITQIPCDLNSKLYPCYQNFGGTQIGFSL